MCCIHAHFNKGRKTCLEKKGWKHLGHWCHFSVPLTGGGNIQRNIEWHIESIHARLAGSPIIFLGTKFSVWGLFGTKKRNNMIRHFSYGERKREMKMNYLVMGIWRITLYHFTFSKKPLITVAKIKVVLFKLLYTQNLNEFTKKVSVSQVSKFG